MKHLYLIILSSFLYNVSLAQCCPEFKLDGFLDTVDCSRPGQPVGTIIKTDYYMCKGQSTKLRVVPQLPGFTYNWSVTGATINNSNSNPVIITWDTTGNASLSVIVSNGSCIDTISATVTLSPPPIAAISYTPTTNLCVNTPINFSGTGSSSLIWDFGDGTTATGPSQTHSYSSPGTYTVTLTAENIKQTDPCGCKDTAQAIITINNGTVPNILAGCKKMLCVGDTQSYCTSPACPPFTWSVDGGTIISNTGNCIKVVWNTPPANYPPTVNLTTGSCGQCTNSATLPVNVLYPAMAIGGPTNVCSLATSTYTIASIPGTFYKWTLSGGGTIISNDSNVTSINVAWGIGFSTETITCTYYNPITNCSGTSTKIIDIRPEFLIGFPVNSCVNSNSGFFALLGNADWSITPNSGFNYIGANTNTNSINVFWLAPDTFTIQATTNNPSNFCTISDKFEVIISDTPTISLIGGPTTYCPGINNTYSVATNINTGIFTWSVSPQGSIVANMGALSDSIAIDWIGATGTQTITVSQSTGVGCLSGPKTLIVNPVPAPILGTNPIGACVDEIQVFNAVNNSPSYFWFILPPSGGTFLSGQNTSTPQIQWHGQANSTSSVYTVSVVTCGGIASTTITVVQPLPVSISVSGNLCTGITLTSSITGVAYQWYLNNTPIPSSNVPSIIIYTPGQYSVEVFQTIGGCASKAKKDIPPLAKPFYITSCGGSLYQVGDTLVYEVCSSNLNTTLSINPNGNLLSYQWYNNSFANPVGTNSPNLNVNTLGVYFAVTTNLNTGCMDTLGYISLDTICCLMTPVISITDTGCTSKKGFNATITPQPSPLFPQTWCFGDGAGGISTNLNIFHEYLSAGNYSVCMFTKVISGIDTCLISRCSPTAVNLVANFNESISCGSVQMTNASTALPAFSGYTTTWSVSGPGTFTVTPSLSSPNPNFSVSTAGTYIFTLTISANGCTSTKTKAFYIPKASANITGPDTVCLFTSAPYSTPTVPGGLYTWDFGDNATSFIPNTSHEYANPFVTFTMTLTVVDADGCFATSTKNVYVDAPPIINITPNQTVCPGNSALFSATPVLSGYSYQWYYNNSPITSSNSPNYVASNVGSYYVEATSSNLGCKVKSLTTNLYHYMPAHAQIKQIGSGCFDAINPTNFQLVATNANPANTYNWYIQNNSTIIATDDTLNVNTNISGNYSYVLEAITPDGCKAYDTLCVIVAQSPNISVITIPASACAGKIATAIAISNTTTPYLYSWSNGDQDSITTIIQSGTMVAATDTATGCTTTLMVGMSPSADIKLMPVGCTEICNDDSIQFPVPYPSGFTVTWYANGNYGTPIVVGPTILLSSLPAGITTLNCVATIGLCSDTTDLLAVTNYDCNVTPLGNQVIQLKGEDYNMDHLLAWISTHPFIQFGVERSLDGKVFHQLAEVSSSEYLSKNNVSRKYFYRILGRKQDGTSVYSNIIKLGGLDEQVKIYPNPVTDFMQVQANGQFTVVITDLLGHKILQQNGAEHTIIDISDLANGHYFVRVGDKVELIFKK